MECIINKTKINYTIKGEGQVVLSIHGFFPDHRLMTGCLEPVFQERKGYKRIYFDLPYMGKSTSDELIPNADRMLDIVLKFIDKVLPKENFLLCSQSYGSYLARGILAKKQEFVDGLLMICPVIHADVKKRELPPHTVIKEDPELLSTLDQDERDKYIPYAVVQDQHNWERFKQEILPGLRLANQEMLSQFQSQGYSFSFDVDKGLKSIQKPTLIFLGKQDAVVGYQDALKLANNYPRAKFAVLDNAGHNLQIDQEKAFNSLTHEWLDRVEDR